MLVSEVLEEGRSIAAASRRLNIKLSTAKLIVKTFRERGVLVDKRMKKHPNIDIKNPFGGIAFNP